MKIAIIGCGYVGQAIAREWFAQGHELTVTTTTPEKILQLQTFSHQAKLFRSNQLEAFGEILNGQDLLLLSLAAQGRTPEGYRASYLQTAQTLTQILPHHPSIKQIIYTSSYSVIGDHQGQWVDENTIPKPVNLFSEILLETEQVLETLAIANRAVCILRLGGIYGPNRELLKIFRSWFGTTRPGTGNDYGNWIHLTDIVNGIEFARSQQLSGLFNLVDSDPIPRKELLDHLAIKHQLPPVEWNTNEVPAKAYNVRVSNQKIRDLGFQFTHETMKH